VLPCFEKRHCSTWNGLASFIAVLSNGNHVCLFLLLISHLADTFSPFKFETFFIYIYVYIFMMRYMYIYINMFVYIYIHLFLYIYIKFYGDGRRHALSPRQSLFPTFCKL
jgi:hypothetical protein